MKPLVVNHDHRSAPDLPKYADIIRYCDCDPDVNGWCDASRFLPVPYDLCDLKKADGTRATGWWTGNTWYGHRIRPCDTIAKWRRLEGY